MNDHVRNANDDQSRSSGNRAKFRSVISDTDPRVLDALVAGYRRMSLAEKFARVEQLNEAVLSLAAARIRKEHPNIGDRELRLRLASLWLDADTMKRAFGWEPRTSLR